ncbi:hypothetical protein L3Q82_026746 [Scortum barcoo]|uniref:Uncharacterized protein n=1 Tax=Scortum barcoo TaxID=214431 RepID=A0ACB8WJL2_9TELE|nr:hypothetical protein L3Q82_026746 [Scortum barcoo]
MQFSSRSWNTGPALYRPQGASGFMGVCPTSPHVLCGSEESIRSCPSWYSVCRVLREYGFRGPLLRAVRSLYDRRSRSLVRALPAVSQTCSQCMLDSSRAALCHTRPSAACTGTVSQVRISTIQSKSEAMVLDRKRVALWVGGRGPASSGGVSSISGSLVHEWRERWSVRLTGRLVQPPQ